MNITKLAKRLCLPVLLMITPAAFAAEQMMPSPPQLAAKSYVLMDASSGNVLVENNGDERLPPASLTKLMTPTSPPWRSVAARSARTTR